jgi:hypothetical protein
VTATELSSLDPAEILKTAERLRDRIAERFPGSGLSKVGDQLVLLASRAGATSSRIKKPNHRVRAISYVVIALLVVAPIAGTSLALGALDRSRGITWAELVQVIEAGSNDLLLLGAAIYFLVSYETRFKRGKVVKALHQLRTLAHLIDVHQLTKTPEVLGNEALRTESSPKRTFTAFELGRYLDYCTEMLSLTGKIAALYGDGFDDAETLEAVNEIEELTIGLQTKIWQKLILLQELEEARGAYGDERRESLAPPAVPVQEAPVAVVAGSAGEEAQSDTPEDALLAATSEGDELEEPAEPHGAAEDAAEA